MSVYPKFPPQEHAFAPSVQKMSDAPAWVGNSRELRELWGKACGFNIPSGLLYEEHSTRAFVEARTMACQALNLSKWSQRTSAARLLELDVRKDLLPRDDVSIIGPGAPGSAPGWLRCDLPRRLSPAPGASTVDLALPLECNPFFQEMGDGLVTQLRTLTASYSHSLLLGCSGCGKTSACLALAREQYVIYLEVPDEDAATPIRQRGFRMSPAVWSSKRGFLKTYEDVEGALYAEIVSRLVVLRHLLQNPAVTLTPLQWLEFTMSTDGSKRIGHVVDSIVSGNLRVDPSTVDDLMISVTELISQRAGAPYTDYPESRFQPVLVVDELQVLGSRSVEDGTPARKSLMRAAVDAACFVGFSVVWSGTRLHVMNAISKTSAFAKSLPNARELNIVGAYKYLDSEDVSRLLHQVLRLDSVDPSVLSQLCYGLQGRARTCAGFIAHLLTPGSDAMKPGAVLEDVLLDVFEDFMTTAVFERVHADLASYSDLPKSSLNTVELGHLFCHTMLPTLRLPNDADHRQNCIAFTANVSRVPQDAVSGQGEPSGGGEKGTPLDSSVPQEVRYAFEYRYGEPSLQEALLRYVRAHPDVADQGICKLLTSALAASELGQHLDYAVILSLLCRGSIALRGLVAGTTFGKFASYKLSLSRVISTPKAEHQLEWFQRVLNDPNDSAFSLLPGVPVKHIAILPSVYSGADGICVALPADQQSEEQPFISNRKRKGSPAQPLPELVFVQNCCATYEGGVTAEKHKDQMKKCNIQFADVSPSSCVVAKKYRKMALEHADKFEIIPLVVEIPGNANFTPTTVTDVVMVTEVHKGDVLLSRSAIQALMHPRKASAPAAGVKG